MGAVSPRRGRRCAPGVAGDCRYAPRSLPVSDTAPTRSSEYIRGRAGGAGGHQPPSGRPVPRVAHSQSPCGALVSLPHPPPPGHRCRHDEAEAIRRQARVRMRRRGRHPSASRNRQERPLDSPSPHYQAESVAGTGEAHQRGSGSACGPNRANSFCDTSVRTRTRTMKAMRAMRSMRCESVSKT